MFMEKTTLRISTPDLRILIHTVLYAAEPGDPSMSSVPLPHLPGRESRDCPSSKPLLVWGRGCMEQGCSSMGVGG